MVYLDRPIEASGAYDFRPMRRRRRGSSVPRSSHDEIESLHRISAFLRGLFVKLTATFFLVCFVSMLVVGWLDVRFSSLRFEHDARALLGSLDARRVAAAVADGGAAHCAATADALFRHVIAQGTGRVADFDAMLGYFYSGRLRVEIVEDARTACASGPAPAHLLGAALVEAAHSTAPTLLREGGEWALVVPLALGDARGARALIGVQFWPEWGTHSIIGYDVIRSLVFIAVLGISFTIAVAWFVLRRIRRATRAADRWAAGDLGARIAERPGDEFGALAERFNRMADALARTIETEKALATSVERNRIGRDLHDTAKQRSFVLGLKLTELEHDAQGHAQLTATIADARRLADHLQQDLVRAVSGFRLPAVNEAGLRDALLRGVGDLLSGSRIAWSLDLPPDAERFLEARPVLAQELMVITHEAVANARRHSGCTHIRVIAAGGPRFAWAIEDDGNGFDPARRSSGMGLTNLRWRARALPDGRLDIESSPSGTCIVVTFAAGEGARA